MKDLKGIRHRSLGLDLLALVVAAMWGFIELADEVVEQEIRHFDQTVLLTYASPTIYATRLARHGWMGAIQALPWP